MEKKDKDSPLPPFQESSNPPIPHSGDAADSGVPGVAACAGRDTGGSVDSGSLTSPAAGCVYLLSHTARGTRPCLPRAPAKAPSRPRDPMVLVTHVKDQV